MKIKYDEIDIIVIIINKIMRENLINNQVKLRVKMRNLGKGKDRSG